jgi:hypothetical protein
MERKRGRPKKENRKSSRDTYQGLKERMEQDGRVQVGTWVRIETLQWLKEESSKREVSIGVVIDQMIDLVKSMRRGERDKALFHDG